MPVDWSQYPANWPEIRAFILRRAAGRCECRGECGVDHFAECEIDNVDPAIVAELDRRRCPAENKKRNPTTGSIVVLTVAHLDHDPANSNSGNLRGFCQRCHNTYDAEFRAANRAKSRRQRAIDRGQIPLFGRDLDGD